jgi:hypothetical protein
LKFNITGEQQTFAKWLLCFLVKGDLYHREEGGTTNKVDVMKVKKVSKVKTK